MKRDQRQNQGYDPKLCVGSILDWKSARVQALWQCEKCFLSQAKSKIEMSPARGTRTRCAVHTAVHTSIYYNILISLKQIGQATLCPENALFFFRDFWLVDWWSLWSTVHAFRIARSSTSPRFMCRTGDVRGDFELWGQGHSLHNQFTQRPKCVLIHFGFNGLPSHMPRRFWPFSHSATAFRPFRVRQMAPTCWDILDFLRSLLHSSARFFRFFPVPALYTMTTDDWWLLGLQDFCQRSMDSLLWPSEASRKILRTPS